MHQLPVSRLRLGSRAPPGQLREVVSDRYENSRPTSGVGSSAVWQTEDRGSAEFNPQRLCLVREVLDDTPQLGASSGSRALKSQRLPRRAINLAAAHQVLPTGLIIDHQL